MTTNAKTARKAAHRQKDYERFEQVIKRHYADHFECKPNLRPNKLAAAITAVHCTYE